MAHDYQTAIKRYVEELGIVNSYDTWHGMVWYDHSSTVVMCISWNCAGTKNVAKEMRKICAGTVRNRDKTWFSELSDKGVCVVGHMEIQIYHI